DTHRGDLRGRGHHVVHQRLRSRLTLIVVRELFVERAADALRDAAVNLSLDDARIDQGPGIAGDRVVDDRELSRLALDLDDGDVRAVRERRARRGEVVCG